MKRHNVACALFTVALMSSSVFGQQRWSGAVSWQDGDLRAVAQALTIGGAWWTNAALLTRVGVTDEQKLRLERAFENHRPKLESARQLLEKEEGQLSTLINSEPLDRSAILSQIDRVVQARGDMERANSAMTLEMREVLTLAQWRQVPQGGLVVQRVAPLGVRGAGAGGRGAPAGARGAGQRQQ